MNVRTKIVAGILAGLLALLGVACEEEGSLDPANGGADPGTENGLEDGGGGGLDDPAEDPAAE